MANQAVQRLIQAKLRISRPNDIYEQEADRVAEEVVRSPHIRFLQRKCTPCEAGGPPCPECEEEEDMVVQRTANGMGMESVPGTFLENLGPDQPLDPSTRAFMESRFGHDFGQVRVHIEAKAAESARAVNALAYTVGRDIVFGQGRYSPVATEGRKLLAHELMHIVQQNRRSVGLSLAAQRENNAAAVTNPGVSSPEAGPNPVRLRRLEELLVQITRQTGESLRLRTELDALPPRSTE